MSSQSLETPFFTPPSEQLAHLPGFRFIDHIAISVPQGTLEQQVSLWQSLGCKVLHRETMEGSDQVREVLMQIGESPNLLQFIEPLSDHSTVQKAIDRNGGKGGLHHIGIRVHDIDAAYQRFAELGYRLLDEAPRAGSRGTQVFFVHPKGLPNIPSQVLLEIVWDPANA